MATFAAAHGADQQCLMQRSGLAASQLDDRNGRIPLDRYQALILAAQDLCEDPAIALKWAAAVDMADLSIVGLIMNAAHTMGEAFAQMQRYSALALEIDSGASGPRFELQLHDQDLWMVDTRGEEEAFYQLTEIAFARLTCGPRRFLDQPHILEAHFKHPDPGCAAEYKAVFKCPVIFSSKWNALKLHPDVASWPVATQPDYVLSILTKHADEMLDAHKRSSSTSREVYRLLSTELHKGGLTAETVADALGIGRQTLYRKLQDEGTSFSQILEDVRESMAKDYLKSKGATVSETAYVLGYSDPAAFSRAFKRWTGVSPKDF